MRTPKIDTSSLVNVFVRFWDEPAYAKKLKASPREALMECGICVGEETDIEILNSPSDLSPRRRKGVVRINLPERPQHDTIRKEELVSIGGLENAGSGSRVTIVGCTECCKPSTKYTSKHCCKG